MSKVTVGTENGAPVDLHYEDVGRGSPVVLVHGWPLSGRSWEKQVLALTAAGHRVITYDRRGFGESSKPFIGYDYDTLVEDLDKVLSKLDLREVTLVGFSMGGGEVARYLGTHGSARIARAAFIAAVPPYFVKAQDNPAGLDSAIFAGIQTSISKDRPAFLSGFLANFFNYDVLRGERISDEVIRVNWEIAVGASPKATHDLVAAWGTDFRADLARITIPTLVVHGDEDRIVPLAASGKRTHEAVKGSKLVVLKGAPHGLNWTHADELNSALLEFIGGK